MEPMASTPVESSSRASAFASTPSLARATRSVVYSSLGSTNTRSPVTASSDQLEQNTSPNDKTVEAHNNSDRIIERFITLGDFDSATYWIDTLFADSIKENGNVDIQRFFDYCSKLISVREWLRVSAMIEAAGMTYRHVIFAYFHANSLFHQKLFVDLVQMPIGDLLGQSSKDLPVRYMQSLGGVDLSTSIIKQKSQTISKEELEFLDKQAKSLKIESALYLILGRTFLLLENRESATRLLALALEKDPECAMAEQLLLTYKLDRPGSSVNLNKITVASNSVCVGNDPRRLTRLATEKYQLGRAKDALTITTNVLNRYGLYKDCLLTHINCLVQEKDTDALFLLAHRLVDNIPDSEISWYAVALYYYVCKNHLSAKNYMNKATMMSPGFAEGWLAFGHILAAESENEQALNCYYRASRIHERHFEPLLYVAIQYSKTGLKLAKQFLQDASELTKDNPIVLHEQAAILYAEGHWIEALALMEKALLVVIRSNGGTKSQDLNLLLREDVDPYWEPLLNNLGHVQRRLTKFEKAIQCHERALMLNPRNTGALGSLGMCYASMGDHRKASIYFHRALSFSPQDPLLRSMLDRLLTVEQESYLPSMNESSRTLQASMETLEEILDAPLNETQEKARKLAIEKKTRAALEPTTKKPPITRSRARRERADLPFPPISPIEGFYEVQA